MILVGKVAEEKLLNIALDDVLFLPPYDALATPVSAHADMLLFVLESKILCYDEYYKENKSIFDKIEAQGYEPVRIKEKCSATYPNDIALNALKIGDKILCNERYTSKELLSIAKEYGYKIISVKQGYTACSTLVLNDNSAITADPSVQIALENEGVSVLKIGEGDITLQGYSYGFIGGASFVFEGTVYFFGDILTHKDGKKITEFIKGQNMEVFSIFDGGVCDFGGGKVI